MQTKKNNTESSKDIDLKEEGIDDQTNNAKKNLTIGANMNGP